MRMTVIGLGLIGGSLAIDARATGFVSAITGVERSPSHCSEALDRKLVDEILPLMPGLRQADLIVLAIPVGQISELLPLVLDHISESATVVDMGSTKSALAKSVATHSKRANYVAAHPMAGTEHSGPGAALAGLFAGRTAVICDRELSGLSNLQLVEGLFQALRMRVVFMHSEEHDLHAAFISHLSHASSFVLANTVLETEKNVTNIFDLAGGGFESTVRLAKSSPDMWSPIFEQNQEHILSALDAYMKHLKIFRETIATRNYSETNRLMVEANQIRRVLTKVGHTAVKK